MCPFIPKKASALADVKLIENRLVRHLPPPNCEIDRREGCLPVKVICLAVQNPGIEREMGQRRKMEFSDRKWLVVRRDFRLHRVVTDQDARRISDGRIESRVSVPSENDRRNEGEKFHSLNRKQDQCSRRSRERAPAIYITIPPSTVRV